MANRHKVHRRKDNGSREGSVHPARRSVPMRSSMVSAAIAAIALSAIAPSARAAETVLLGGVGSTARFSTDAPTMTLKGLPHDDASFEKTHWGYYRPWLRPWG